MCLILVKFHLCSDKSFSPEELMAMILNNSRQIAENFAGNVISICLCYYQILECISSSFVSNFLARVSAFQSPSQSHSDEDTNRKGLSVLKYIYVFFLVHPIFVQQVSSGIFYQAFSSAIKCPLQSIKFCGFLFI